MMKSSKSECSLELQENLRSDIENQANNERKKIQKYNILNEVIQQIDDELDIPSIHTLLDKTTEENINDIIRAISVLIHTGADVDEHRNGVCILQRLLDYKNIECSSDLDAVIEMVLNSSQIDYKMYKDGSLIGIIKDFSTLMYIKFRLLTNNNDDFLDLIEDPEYRITIENNLYVVTSRAVGLGKLKIVKRLFEIDTDDIFNNVFEMSDLLRKAIAVGCLHTLQFLLKKVEAKRFVLNTPLLILTVQEVVNVKCDDKFKFYECFDYVLRMADTNVNQRDHVGNVALYYACRYDDEYIIEELLKAKSWIGNKNERGQLPIDRIDAKKLEKYLDSCVKTRVFSAQFHQKIDKDNLVFFDYSCFVPPIDVHSTTKRRESTAKQPNFITEMDTLNFIAETSSLKHLISHPLLRAFIQLKWRRFWPYIFINQQCSFFFLIITCLIMVNNYNKNQITVGELSVPVIIFGSFSILLEIIRFGLLRLRYFKQPINLMYIISIVFCFCYIAFCKCVNSELEDGKTINCEIHRSCYQIAGFLALLWSIKFTILLYTFVSHMVGIYTVMLYKVAYNSLVCIMSNFMLFVGFSLAFFAIFNNLGVSTDPSPSSVSSNATSDDSGINNFNTVGKAIYKVYVMFTGEMDAADLTYRDNLSYILLAVFIFVGPIVAFNLLNGLAVDDVQQIRAEAERISLRILCSLVTDFEYMLHSPFLKFYNSIMNHVFQVNTNLISILCPDRMPFGRIAVDLVTRVTYTFATRYDMFARTNKKFLYKLEKNIVKDAEIIIMGD